VSRDLVLSSVTHVLPFHDCAVIVQKDRIAAAACFLPLTTNPDLASHFGTRHRAAIGITEETDCLSLVVSEETGRISIASYGELLAGISVAELLDHINKHFGLQRALGHVDHPDLAPPLHSLAEESQGRSSEP